MVFCLTESKDKNTAIQTAMTIDLHAAAPHLDPSVAARAATAYTCATERGRTTDHLLIADMSESSSEPRLWVFDMRDPSRPSLIERTQVAHGAGSDPKKTGIPQSFGNGRESGKTSLGLYRVAEPYVGVHGKSYILDGLTPGFDDSARARSVVLHPAPYVRDNGGPVGRSLGCPAINPTAFTRLDKKGALHNALLWIDGPDPTLTNAPSLRCAPAPAQACRQDNGPWPAASWQWDSTTTTVQVSPWTS